MSTTAAPRALATRHPWAGTTTVIATVAASLVLDAVIAATGPAAERTSAVVSGVVVALLLVVFWWGGAALIDAGARAMGRRGAMVDCRGRLARVLPVFLSYPLLTLLQIGAHDGGLYGLVPVLGWLGLPLLAGVIALMTRAVARVYDLDFLGAFALALLPLAATTALLLTAVVVVSALSALGI